VDLSHARVEAITDNITRPPAWSVLRARPVALEPGDHGSRLAAILVAGKDPIASLEIVAIEARFGEHLYNKRGGQYKTSHLFELD